MASQKAVTANAYKNDGGKIMGGGANTSSRWSAFDIMTAMDHNHQTKTTLSSSHVQKAVSAGTYDVMTAGQYVARLVNTQLAGVTTSVVRSPAGAYNTRPYNGFISYNRHHVTARNIYGQNTYGGSRGGQITMINPIGGSALTTGETYPSKAIPGEFVINTGSANPTMSDYTPYN
jgi:uncharacterized Zn-binding protein involved in type VI secretion